MHTALVTGGCGFIGSNLVHLLLQTGVAVKVLDDLSTGYLKNLDGLAVLFKEGDVRDYAAVKEAMLGADVVFHLAASVGRQKSLDNPQRDSETNLIGTLNVLEAARKLEVHRIVYSSSAAIFGELLPAPVSEDHPQRPDSPYGVSKLAGEKQALCYAALYGMTIVCLRYFNVYGDNQRFDAYGNVIPIFADRLYRRAHLTIYGDGGQTRDFVNVRDVAKANLLAATVPNLSGVYNVGSGTSISINDLAALMREISGYPAPIDHEPERPADVRHCQANIAKAREELGFSPDPDIRAGIARYYAWFMRDRAGTSWSH